LDFTCLISAGEENEYFTLPTPDLFSAEPFNRRIVAAAAERYDIITQVDYDREERENCTPQHLVEPSAIIHHGVGMSAAGPV
jgi:hypothetical protein